MKTTDIDQAADDAVALLKALANANRLKLLCHMVDRERSVGELAHSLGVRDTVVSQHLALLRRDGLVDFRRSGQTLWYRLKDPAARQIIAVLYGIFCVPGAAAGNGCGGTSQADPPADSDRPGQAG